MGVMREYLLRLRVRRQMGVGLVVLMETKVTDDCHPHLASGYKILALKAASHNQGGIALL